MFTQIKFDIIIINIMFTQIKFDIIIINMKIRFKI